VTGSRIAARWAGFETSIFTEMTELARAHGAVNLAQGFPDFDGPPELLRAVEAHLRTGHHQYAPAPGEERLRRAVAGFVRDRTGIEADPASEVTITTGATEAIYAVVNAFVDPGDRVVVFEPFYDSYAQAIANAGGVLVPIRLQAPQGDDGAAAGDWTVAWEELDAAVATGFRLLILNSPHNPTGKLFAGAELDRIAAALRATGALALCDEVYEELVFDGARHESLAARADLRGQVIRISSAAKTFGVTGFKVGWVTAPPDLTRAIRIVHQGIVFCTPPFLQTALAEVMEDGPWLAGYLAELHRSYQAKRDFLAAALLEAGFAVTPSPGSYFLMAGFDRMAPTLTDVALARQLIVTHGVAAIPPSVFYARKPARLPWLRFAFCKRDETLARAAQRLQPP
jgi:methionine transaminase